MSARHSAFGAARFAVLPSGRCTREQTAHLGDFLLRSHRQDQMATRPVEDYEAALDDIATRGAAAIRDTKARFDEAVSDAAETGREALDSAREARDSLADSLLHAVKVRPYTTLAIAGLIGFLYGAMRRR